MPFVLINGRRLFYTNDGDSGTGVTTLFIHGLGSSSCFFYSIIPGLKSFSRCIALDTPGSGQSELGESELSISSVAEDAIGLLDALIVKEKVVLVGHSVGCTVVDYLAATYPDRVRAIILLGPMFPNPAMAPVLEERIKIVQNDGLSRLATSIPKGVTGDKAGSIQRAFIRTLILSTSPEGYIALCHAMATAEEPNYDEITVPLLMIIGLDDVTNPLSRPKEILEKFGTKKSEKSITELCGVGHWHCVEAPDDVEDLIGKFVQALV